MNAKFTPGPWRAIHVDGCGDWGVYVEQNETDVDLTICHVCNESNWHPEKGYAKANAKLIAAAPELLEALKRFVDHFGDPFKCARAAIYEATGELFP